MIGLVTGSRFVSGQTQKRFIMTAKNTLVSGGRISASVIQALCGLQLWVPSPPALATKAVTVGTWHRSNERCSTVAEAKGQGLNP